MRKMCWKNEARLIIDITMATVSKDWEAEECDDQKSTCRDPGTWRRVGSKRGQERGDRRRQKTGDRRQQCRKTFACSLVPDSCLLFPVS
jgi:hypothetical protein